MSQARRKRISWIAAAALLFSALSPAMASALFAERPHIMARILGVPAQHSVAHHAAVNDADACPHEAAATAHHGNTSPQADDTSEHAAHGIYCSFCLAAASKVGMPAVPLVPVALLISVAEFIPTVVTQPPAANLRLTRHPRDPPPGLVLS